MKKLILLLLVISISSCKLCEPRVKTYSEKKGFKVYRPQHKPAHTKLKNK